MSSRIDLTLSPSATAGLLATLPWLALAGFITAAGFSGWPVLFLLLPVAAGCAWRGFRRYGLLRGANAVVALSVDSQGLCCQCADGRILPVTVDRASCLASSFLALKLRAAGATSGTLFTLIISEQGPLRANAPTDDVRRLTMWLRLGQAHSV